MGTCFCTGACMRGEGCAAWPMGHPANPLPGYTVPAPLTEETVRRIIREELERLLSEEKDK